MKILIIMDPGILIPVTGYGGHERLVEMLAKEYKRLGHEVHLLITSNSQIEGCVVHSLGKEGFPPSKLDAFKALPTAWQFLRKNRCSFDLVHNFGRLAYLIPILHEPVKKIMTYGREISTQNINYIKVLGSKNLVFTACSLNLLSRMRAPGNWEVVYNAVNFSNYTLKQDLPADAPLMFLGRLEKVKGCHIAIEVARATGNKLIIAGNVSSLPEERLYFENEIKPHIDGLDVQFISQVNDQQKNDWLRKAKALLFPIEWNEPFGMVMVEAMACGTPVIAFQRGSVSEVIDEGITGFKVNTSSEMGEAVSRLGSISRVRCRLHAMARFDVTVIAKKYLQIIDDKRKKVVIISTHQPVANPRALKEYHALKSKGYLVKYLYAYNADWSYKIDQEKFRNGQLPRSDFIEVGGNPHQSPLYYTFSRIIRKMFNAFSPLHSFFKERSIVRSAFEIRRETLRHHADLYIAHYLGALPGAAKAATKYRAKLVFDAEDYHRGEQSYYRRQVLDTIELEDKFLPRADLITAASPLIACAYANNYPGKQIVTINNYFSRRFLQPQSSNDTSTLKLFWFSQYIDVHRGLEIFIKALNILDGRDISLTIMGSFWSPSYRKDLLKLAKRPDQILFEEPVSPDELFAVAASHDIGLAGEIPNCLNREICLTNKIFTYLLAGNAVLASNVQGQREFMEQHPGIGFTYEHSNENDLAAKLEIFFNNRLLLKNFRHQAIQLGAGELNWEQEQGRWLLLITKLLSQVPASSLPQGEKLFQQRQ